MAKVRLPGADLAPYEVEIERTARSRFIPDGALPGSWAFRGGGASGRVASHADLQRVVDEVRSHGWRISKVVPARFCRKPGARDAYLEANPGPWRCRYCGRRICDPGAMQVDHVIPVALASSSAFYRRLLGAAGAADVDDLANLAPSCPRCNRAKSDSGGAWVVRGYLGARGWWWPAVWVARVAFLALAVGVVAWNVSAAL